MFLSSATIAACRPWRPTTRLHLRVNRTTSFHFSVNFHRRREMKTPYSGADDQERALRSQPRQGSVERRTWCGGRKRRPSTDRSRKRYSSGRGALGTTGKLECFLSLQTQSFQGGAKKKTGEGLRLGALRCDSDANLVALVWLSACIPLAGGKRRWVSSEEKNIAFLSNNGVKCVADTLKDEFHHR